MTPWRRDLAQAPLEGDGEGVGLAVLEPNTLPRDISTQDTGNMLGQKHGNRAHARTEAWTQGTC